MGLTGRAVRHRRFTNGPALLDVTYRAGATGMTATKASYSIEVYGFLPLNIVSFLIDLTIGMDLTGVLCSAE